MRCEGTDDGERGRARGGQGSRPPAPHLFFTPAHVRPATAHTQTHNATPHARRTRAAQVPFSYATYMCSSYSYLTLFPRHYPGQLTLEGSAGTRRGSRDRPGGPRIPMLRLGIGFMGRATVFREFDKISPKLFTPTLTLFTAPWTGSI